jgi:type III secretion system FlhB-like substrate exporter
VASRPTTIHSLSLVHIGAAIANSVYVSVSRVLSYPVRLELKSARIWVRNRWRTNVRRRQG